MKIDAIRDNIFFTTFEEIIEENWKSAFKKGAALTGLSTATALGTHNYDKPKEIPEPTPIIKHHTVDSRKKTISDIDKQIKAKMAKEKQRDKQVNYRKTGKTASDIKPIVKTNTQLSTIDTIVNLIIKHEGLEPKQTPVRITSHKMRNWDHVLGFEIDKNYLRHPSRGNFFYLEDPSKVDDLIKKLFRLYSIYPHKYNLPRNPTLKQCIHKFDQSGAKGKIAFLKSKLPTLDINRPISEYF